MSESILRTRHSARSFLDKPVEESVIREIIADAALAPSWCNSQPWKAYVITGELAKKVNKTHYENNVNEAKAWCEVVPPILGPEAWHPEHWENMLKFWKTADVVVPESKDSLGFLDKVIRNFNSPAIVYLTVPKDSSAFLAYDVGAFGYGVCLAAHEHGLASIPAYEFVRYPEEVRAVIDIPEDESIFMGIGLGYPDDSELNQVSIRNGRAPLDNILKIVSE